MSWYGGKGGNLVIWEGGRGERGMRWHVGKAGYRGGKVGKVEG